MQTELLQSMLPLFILIGVWELIWKGFALWKAGRNNQKYWYICILIFNTVGILPIVYLFYFGNKAKKKVS